MIPDWPSSAILGLWSGTNSGPSRPAGVSMLSERVDRSQTGG